MLYEAVASVCRDFAGMSRDVAERNLSGAQGVSA